MQELLLLLLLLLCSVLLCGLNAVRRCPAHGPSPVRLFDAHAPSLTTGEVTGSHRREAGKQYGLEHRLQWFLRW